MKYVLTCICLVTCFSVFCQETVAPEVIPYRPRLAEFTITSLYNYKTVSDSETFGSSKSEIELDQKIKARLGIPLVMKENTLMGLQLKYDNHDFIVEFETPYPYELYDYIKEARFRSVGGRFLLSKEIDEGKDLTVMVGSEIKSDKLVFNKHTSKTYANVNYKIEKNSRVTIGAGLALAYTLGVPQVYPLFFYANELSSRWTLDLNLPKSAIMRLKLSEKCFLSFKTEVKGWRYAIHNHELSETVPLTLRKSDVHFGLNFEHEIHDWLWFGVDSGLSHNLRHYLAEPGGRRRDAVINLQSNSAPYTKLSIFIVPPKKIYK